jgi:phosphoglycerol transferase MdoB-like AlkP superfamily enzyme
MQSEKAPRNVVVLLMESLGREHIGVRTPFLDSLIKKSEYFPNSFSNGRRSNEGLVSIYASLPMLMDDPFMHSVYAGNKFNGLPKYLTNLGYETFFLNGSPKNLLAWTEFLNATGNANYISRENYKKKDHDDGRWGIYDHYFLPWTVKQLPTDKLFFSVIFSLSSHHPFLVPIELKDNFSETDPYLKSIQYADYALKLFFDEAKTKKWFKNTIFIITADHTLGANNKEPKQGIDLPYFKSRVGLYATPFIVYDPMNEVSQTNSKLVSQVDIMPTVLDLAGYKGRYFSFGESIFAEKQDRFIYHFVNNHYSVMNEKHILLFDGAKTLGLFDHVLDPSMKHDLVYKDPTLRLKLENALKAYLQTYLDGLKKNRLSY